MDKKAFKRFVSNHWLSMVPVCHRIIKNWLIEYFLNTEQTKSIKKSSMFIRIAGKLKERNLMLARLEFINSIAQLSEPYLIRLQTESILIHTLYDELVQLLRLLMNRFVKGNILENKNDCDLSEIVLEPNPADQCEFGTHTQKLVRALKNEKTES